MRPTKAQIAGLLLIGGLGVTIGVAGCGSGNPNEREYMATAPPGQPPDDPDDQKVAHRRERTRGPSKQVEQAEKRKAAARK
jgi:hypothetical protein